MNKWIFDTLPSTNDVAVDLARQGKSGVVCAKTQTMGRGRKGRSFESQTGGLYCSFVFQYEDFAATRAFEIMRKSCLAVVKTLNSFGITAGVKWPNDVLVNGKKICGILIETAFSGKNIAYAVVGIGINVNNTLGEEIRDIATTMAKQTGKVYDVEQVLDELCQNIQCEYRAEDYRAVLLTLGKNVLVEDAEGTYPAVCTDVASDGRLVVEVNGTPRFVSAGDVTVRESK